MTLSIWRLSHLILALTASVFVLIASVTGAILAFEPISNQLKPYVISDLNSVSIAETLVVLKDNYAEVISVQLTKDNFVKASVITNQGKSSTFYIHPTTGKKLGDIVKKEPIFEFATNLHRSLFLKSTGRFLVGLASFLLLLITVTGVKLIAKRQGGFRLWFSKVIKENYAQYYHVVIGRLTLIPLIIICVTGVFLSLERFSVLPKSNNEHQKLSTNLNAKKSNISDFKIFKNNTLNNLVSLEFPFSKDEEDYFVLTLKNKEVYINQYTGAITSRAGDPFLASLIDWSLVLHTGSGTILWSIILLLSCIAILFFMYSGFFMTIRRRKESRVFKNTFQKDNAEYIILVGSERGSTFSFATQFAQGLIDAGKTTFVDVLDNYSVYQQAKQLIIFTSTYGEGEAPANAKKFIKTFQDTQNTTTFTYAVVGFGSLMYPQYCKFAIMVDALLQKDLKFSPILPLFKINNQSFEAFKTWINQWSLANGIKVKINPRQITKNKKLKSFKVIHKTKTNRDDTFLIELKAGKNIKFQSGDLLVFYPKEDQVERLYSIGRINNNILLSIKKHEFGVCSNCLNEKKITDMLRAKIKQNLDFHFPNYAPEVIMIANGTGIAPFLGMINSNTKNIKTHLFWGGRTQDSLELYSQFIDSAFNKNRLSSLNVAYSQGKNQKNYVQDLISEHTDLFCKVLNNKGVIMICGAVAMQNKVIEILDTITKKQLDKPISDFENNEQLMMDCY